MKGKKNKTANKNSNFGIDPTRCLSVSAYGEGGDGKLRLPVIHIEANRSETLLALLASDESFCKETSSQKVFLDKVIDGMFVGFIKNMSSVWVHKKHGGIDKLCALLDDNGFSDVSEIIKVQWLQEGLFTVGFSGHGKVK